MGLLKKFIMKAAGFVFAHPKIYLINSKFANKLFFRLPKSLINIPFKMWTKSRDLPEIPSHTFTEWYKKNRKI
jgi:L-lactate dehydrogenase complex protein LldF